VASSPLRTQHLGKQWISWALCLSGVVLCIPSAFFLWAFMVESFQQWRCGASNAWTCLDAIEPAQQQLNDAVNKLIFTSAGLIFLWALGLGSLIYLNTRKGKVYDENYIRGAVKAPEKIINELTASARQKEDGPHIEISDVIFPRYLETGNILTCGDPGSGKTTAFQLMLMPINLRKTDKACIYDCKGSYLKKFYNAKRGDIILGLTELANATWNVWDEFPDGVGFQKFVELVIPKEQGTTYWVDNGRIVLLELIKKCTSWKQLREIISSWSIVEVVQFLEDTPAKRALLSKYGEEILSGVNSRTAWLDNFEDANPCSIPLRGQGQSPLDGAEDGKTTDSFSFHEWAKNKDNNAWVFLFIPERHSAESAPMLAVYFDLVAQATMERESDHTGFNRLWMVLDEITSAGYQPRLKHFLGKGREYGGCAMIGFQLISQVRTEYGVNETQTIFGLCQSKLILRTSDDDTCKFLAGNIGSADYYEPTFSVSDNGRIQTESNGAQRRNDHLFLPSEIQNLPQFNAILVMPTYPRCQLMIKADAHALPNVTLPEPKKKLSPLEISQLATESGEYPKVISIASRQDGSALKKEGTQEKNEVESISEQEIHEDEINDIDCLDDDAQL
jgi:Type IV secretion-system coupling protein DNA-binding domain